MEKPEPAKAFVTDLKFALFFFFFKLAIVDHPMEFFDAGPGGRRRCGEKRGVQHQPVVSCYGGLGGLLLGRSD